MREALSRMADATTAAAGRVVGAAIEGLIGGAQDAADGIRNGWRKGSQSIAGRPGMAWAKGVLGGIQGATKGIRDGWNTGS
jgi:hypothetical protein